MNIEIVSDNIAIIAGDTGISKWVQESGKLAHDETVNVQILPWLRPGDVAVDAGAFIGTITSQMLNKVQDGTVLAFEPNPYAFKALQHNCPKAKCFNNALGATRGQKHLEIDSVNVGGTHCGELILAKGAPFPVDVIALDELDLPKLRFLKLDVEGMEPEVILGAIDTIRRCMPVMFIEINHGTLARRGHTYDSILSQLLPFRYEMQLTNPNQTLNSAEWPQIDVVMRPHDLQQ